MNVMCTKQFDYNNIVGDMCLHTSDSFHFQWDSHAAYLIACVHLWTYFCYHMDDVYNTVITLDVPSQYVVLVTVFTKPMSFCQMWIATDISVAHYFQTSVSVFPLLSTRQHPSYGDCLEVKREYYQNSSVLDCVTQCSQSAAHLYEQFLQV